MLRKRTIFTFIFFNIQILKDMNLDNNINVGYTATKRLGNAIKRNKAKRIMRELAKKVISKYGKKIFIM